ncbi:MAG: ABC transporter permease [Azospirillaceae bacterium]
MRRLDAIALVWWVAGTAAVFFMLAPLVALFVFSFSAGSVLTLPVTGWSVRWYRELAATPEFWIALKNSLVVCVAVGFASTTVGTMAAMAMARLPARRAGALISVFSLPVMLPPLVLALSMLTFFVGTGLGLGLPTVILGHLVYTLPFVVLIVYARMAAFDPAIIDSARDLGASPWRTFATVVLPVARPTIIGAALVAMALSLDDFVIALFTIGGGNTLPTFMWGMLRKGVNPGINVVGVVLVTLILVASLLALRVTRYRG